MSTEIEEQLTVVQSEDNLSSKSSGKVIKSYAREFLLSLSELEICKKLPKDFDEAFLSDFQESSYGHQDRPRVLGSSPLQPFRRTDYGSSPPTRGDSSSYSRGPQRWGSRSSEKSEGDSESESGRRFGSQARRTGQSPEHDGLLGSGSFPRPPGNAPSSVVPRFRPSENLQLNKSNEPYQPPRPYKAGPYSRRETKDSFNDETFGSSDTTTEDRAEEEKNRRAEFELMRKERHKAFQESQNLNTGKPKDSFAEMVGLLENPNDSKLSSGLENVLKEALYDDASKLSVVSQSPPTRRPLVPPGFVCGAVDKSSASKSHMHADALMVGDLELEHGHQDVKSITQERGSSNRFGEVSSLSNFKAKSGLSSILHDFDQAKALSVPGTTEIFENSETLEFDSEIIGHKALGEPVRSKSILDKLFINGLTTTCESTSDILEGNDPKTDDIWSPDKLNSKFARLFNDDRKNLGHTSSEKPSSLLSLIIGGEKGGNDELNAVAIAPPVITTDVFPWQEKTRSTSSKAGEVPEQVCISNDPVPKPSVLTCEDLEQSMLSEIGQDVSNSRSPEKERDTIEIKKDVLPGSISDNSASQHLLSLLQGGMGLVERPPDEYQKLPKSGLPENSSTHTSGIRELTPPNKTLTLESLFGTAFMKELHSAQRNSSASNGGPLPPKMGEDGDNSHEGNILRSNDGITQLDKVTDWLDFQDTGKNMDLLGLSSKADSKIGVFDEGVGVNLPEEDSLINLIDPINAENSTWMPNSNSSSADLRSLSSNTSVNIMEKFSAMGGALNDERSMLGGPDPFMLHSPYNMGKPEIPYQNLNPGMSSSQFRRPLNQDRTSFNPLDSHPAHIDPHMNFIPPEAVIHRDIPPHHHFPTNMGQPSFTHSNASLGGFDHPVPSPGLHQMLMAGNHPPSHLVRGAPGAAPMAMPPHPSHIPAGFIQGRNPIQGFSFGQRVPSFGGPEMTHPGPELGVGNNPPEAFQRPLEMERANPKQMHPFGTGGPSRGMHGHELEMAYRYR